MLDAHTSAMFAPVGGTYYSVGVLADASDKVERTPTFTVHRFFHRPCRGRIIKPHVVLNYAPPSRACILGLGSHTPCSSTPAFVPFLNTLILNRLHNPSLMPQNNSLNFENNSYYFSPFGTFLPAVAYCSSCRCLSPVLSLLIARPAMRRLHPSASPCALPSSATQNGPLSLRRTGRMLCAPRGVMPVGVGVA